MSVIVCVIIILIRASGITTNIIIVSLFGEKEWPMLIIYLSVACMSNSFGQPQNAVYILLFLY